MLVTSRQNTQPKSTESTIHTDTTYVARDHIMATVEQLFSLLDSDGDGQINRSDILAICDKLELEEGAEAFLSKLGLTDEYRPITIDDVYHSGIFDSVGQSDISHSLASISDSNYEAIFDLLLVLQKTTTNYLRNKSYEMEGDLQQAISERDNFKREMIILLQECDDRERTISELNVREKQLKQEISSLYEQLELCEQRDRTGTEGSFRSRSENQQKSVVSGSKSTESVQSSLKSGDENNHVCENCQRLMEDIKNSELLVERINEEKKRMNVKVHAADTYLTQVKELESAYRNLEQHTMQMGSEHDAVLAEYEETRGNFEELSQRYEELKSKISSGDLGGVSAATLGSVNNLDTSAYTTGHNTTGGFSFADELADTESRDQIEALQEENERLKLKVLQYESRDLPDGDLLSRELDLAAADPGDVIPLINNDQNLDDVSPRGLSSPTDGICGHVLIGTAKLFLHCLRHDIGVSYSPPIVDKNGQVLGHLKVKLQRLSSSHGNLNNQQTTGEQSVMGDLMLGSTVTVHIGVIEANGLPTRLNNYVFCQYKFWDIKDMIIPGLEFQQHLPRNNTTVFEHQETYTVTVTQQFLNYVNDGLLAIEVWGLKLEEESDIPRAGSMIVTNATAPLYDRWSEMMTRLQLWVEVLEINDNGIYSAVEVQQRSDIKTGGVYQLRQGLSRRILVRVLPVGAGGSIACKSISGISIGNITTSSRHQAALDSYQNEDLLKLRCAWSEALETVQNRIGDQLHKLTEKEVLSDAEEEERGKLLEEWIRLLRERDAVLIPKENSGVPGARDTRPVPQGMEVRIPTLFVDVNDQLRQNPKHRIVIGERSNLSGQDDGQMIKLSTVHRQTYIHDITSCNIGIVIERIIPSLPQLQLLDDTLMINIYLLYIGIYRSDDSSEHRQFLTLTPGQLLPPQVKHDQHRVCAIAAWDSSTHESESLNCLTEPEQRVYLILNVSVDVSLPYGMEMELVLRKRVCVRVYKKKSLRDSMRGFMQDIPKRNENCRVNALTEYHFSHTTT
eukprot:sb/3461556/